MAYVKIAEILMGKLILEIIYVWWRWHETSSLFIEFLFSDNLGYFSMASQVHSHILQDADTATLLKRVPNSSLLLN